MKSHMPGLQREKHPIPDFVLDALEVSKLFDAYRARPPYQQNDYIGWISRAKLPATRNKRLQQMLDELKHGGVYMGMKHGPSRK